MTVVARLLSLLALMVRSWALDNQQYAMWFTAMNRDLQNLNQEAARRTWAGLIGEEVNSSYNLEDVRIEWRRMRCSEAADFNTAPPMIRRAAYLLCRGPHLTPTIARKLTSILGYLSDLYKETRLCILSQCYRSEPDLERIMQISRDPDLLLFVWQGWRDAIGPPAFHVYQSLITVQNEAVKSISKYNDMGECWREELEVPELEAVVERLMAEVAPLHKLLHAYVRWALRNYYGPELVSCTKPIPAHILGNMWSQSWESLTDIMLNTNFNLDLKLRSRYSNVTELLREAEKFYVLFGLKPMTDDFWKNSVISKKNEDVSCHGTAANMYRTGDYRMLVCADMTWDDFYVIHHEMGHIQYFMAYENMPTIFQDGANSAFQEAVGDAIMLAVETPSHLSRLDIINQTAEDYEFPLLMYQALKKIPQIPFGLVIDKWRWGVMASNITPLEYNNKWWNYRKTYEGIAPFPRGSNSFDPIAKFHIADNTPYVRYFLSSFLQFQFLDVLCYTKDFNAESRKTPLHLCDLFGYKEGGSKLRKMMEQGNTRTWNELLSEFSDGRYDSISAEPLLQYFDPLTNWLQEQIKKYNIPVGW